MPATSKAQFRFMAAVAHGGIKKPGLSESKAEEFVHGVNYKSLPKKKKSYSEGAVKEAKKQRGQ